jgi:hypothetical protein
MRNELDRKRNNDISAAHYSCENVNDNNTRHAYQMFESVQMDRFKQG